MTTWQDSQFDSKSYAKFRPTYENSLYDAIYNYHQANRGDFGIAVDLGTGTGQVALKLAERFNEVIGVDNSEVMMSSAKQHPKVTYKLGDCLNIPVVDHSVDLLVAAIAIHWFPIPQLWDEIRRVMKPGGTFGFWGYSMSIAPEYPSLTSAIYHLTTDTYGDYWEEGVKRLNQLHQDYFLNLPFSNIQGRVFNPHPQVVYDPQLLDIATPKEGFATNSIPDSGFVKNMTTLNQLRSYLKTWSVYHSYKKKNPSLNDPVDELIEATLKETSLSLDDNLELVYPQEIIICQVP